ncbi:hypothetical protein E2C01_036295 [Portunus trituberculatus]|uniref:Uncharacterized protein n=1 Tax=Portunus trituberculatus TaxID=210409 RepID=A0A5B7FC30_PORTR|nr:hypothetical protein [Portunus trituberculatus]
MKQQICSVVLSSVKRPTVFTQQYANDRKLAATFRGVVVEECSSSSDSSITPYSASSGDSSEAASSFAAGGFFGGRPRLPWKLKNMV